MPHNTKINAIFVDIKTGDYSVSVHIVEFIKISSKLLNL